MGLALGYPRFIDSVSGNQNRARLARRDARQIRTDARQIRQNSAYRSTLGLAIAPSRRRRTRAEQERKAPVDGRALRIIGWGRLGV